jgi:sugar phosphate isomerase/epimerase
VALGKGDVNFPEYLAVLREIGFDGYLTIERECGDDPLKDISEAVQFLKAQEGVAQ